VELNSRWMIPIILCVKSEHKTPHFNSQVRPMSVLDMGSGRGRQGGSTLLGRPQPFQGYKLTKSPWHQAIGVSDHNPLGAFVDDANMDSCLGETRSTHEPCGASADNQNIRMRFLHFE
jgi:hypothetical protein